MKPYLLSLALLAGPVLACQVQTDKAYRDAHFGNWVIPVQLAPGERCVIHDYTSAEGQRTWKQLWTPLEKIGPLHPGTLGRLHREYQLGGAKPVNRYVYTAGPQRGEAWVVFAAFANGVEKRAVAYRLTIR